MIRSMVFAAGGVQGAEHQVAGFRRGQARRMVSGPHLYDQDDVRIFPQRRAQTVEAEVSQCTSRWLTRHFWLSCTNFDRIFDRQDVGIIVGY